MPPEDICPAEHTLVDLVDGELSADESRSVHAHLADCGACRRAVSELARDLTEPDNERPLLPGDPVARYTIERTIGSGGMGVVYLAHDPDLGRKVALKLWRTSSVVFLEGLRPPPPIATSRELGPPSPPGLRKELEARLRREARALAQLAHPNVVAIYEVGVFERRLFLAMEFVPGETLAAWAARTPRTPSEKLAVLTQAGRGLAAAHDASIVHRDFKPSNVLVGEGRVRVVDFGLARAVDAPATLRHAVGLANEGLTELGAVVGTPGYMAPEQRDGGTPDERADQFAFCVTAHELLTGLRPDEGTDSPRSRGVARSVARVLARGLSVDPDDRYPTMRDLVDDLVTTRRAPRRRIYVVSLIGAAGIGAVVAAAALSTEESARCDDVAERLDQTWSVDLRERSVAGIEAVGTPPERRVALGALEKLDAYVAGWGADYREACEGGRSQQVACLEQLRVEASALATALPLLDTAAMRNVPQAIAGLRPLTGCAGDLLPVAPPEFAEELARAKALRRLGKHKDADPILESILATATHDRTRAQALYQLGMSAFTQGDHARAEAQLVEAAQAADISGDDKFRAWAAVGLMSVIGAGYRRIAEADQWRRVAEGAVARLGDHADIALRLRFLNEWGRVLSAGGDKKAARAKHREAFNLAEAELKPDDPRRASSMLRLAWSLEADDAEALPLMLKALQLTESSTGPDHPRLTFYISGLAALRYERGEYEESLALFERVAAMYERAYGADYPDMGVALSNIGEVHIALGNPAQAIAPLKRAIEILEKAYGAEDQGVKSARELLMKAEAAAQ